MRLLSHLYLNDSTLSETSFLCINDAYDMAVNVLKYELQLSLVSYLIMRELQLPLV